MPTVIGFLWPWAINTVFPFPPSSCRSQSYEALASPHLHIYCIGLKSAKWLMWSLPPEFLAAHYYERHGGGCGVSVYSLLKLKRTELCVLSSKCLICAPWEQISSRDAVDSLATTKASLLGRIFTNFQRNLNSFHLI